MVLRCEFTDIDGCIYRYYVGVNDETQEFTDVHVEFRRCECSIQLYVCVCVCVCDFLDNTNTVCTERSFCAIVNGIFPYKLGNCFCVIHVVHNYTVLLLSGKVHVLSCNNYKRDHCIFSHLYYL